MKRLIFFLFLSLNQVFYSQTEWQNIGPGGGSDLLSSLINPIDPNTVFIGGDIEGIYKTQNGGDTWNLINNNLASGPWTPDVYITNQIKFDPSDENYKTLFNCTGIGLFKSVNEGEQWSLLFPKSISSEDDFRFIQSVEIDPENSSIIYVGTLGDGIFRTTDGGDTFEHVDIGMVDTANVYSILIDPTSPSSQRIIYVASTDGVFKSVNNGNTWVRKNSGLPHKEIWNMQGLNINGNFYIYITLPTHGTVGNASSFAGGFFSSTNGGDTWQDLTSNLPRYQADEDRFYFYWKFTVNPLNPNSILIGTGLSYPEEEYEAYEEWGIYRTYNAGQTWAITSDNIVMGWMNETFFDEKHALVLEMAPSDTNIIYWGRDWINKTTDGGETWQQKYTQKVGTAWKGNGFEMMMTEGIGFDPSNSQIIYVAYDDNGPFRSDDGADSFEPLDKVQNPYDNYDAAKDIEIDPANGDVYLSRYDGVGLAFANNFGLGSVYKSVDNGNSWSEISTGIPDGRPDLVMDKNLGSPGQRVLYCASYGNGVYKTTNSGKSWTQINNGLGNNAAGAWEIFINPNNSNELYLGINNIGEGAGLYKSTNAGSQWNKVTSFPDYDVLCIDYDKTNNILYAGGTENYDWSVAGSLNKSTDNGSTWTQIFDHPRVADVEINPDNPDIIFAVSQSWYSVWLENKNPGIYKSIDGGSTWNNISENLAHTYVLFIALNPHNTSQLFVGTGGGGLWVTDNATYVEGENNELPNSFELHQNYPNPFNPTTIINYSIAKNGFVELYVYNILGQKVAVLVNKEQKVGSYEVQFDAWDLSSGIYFYEIKISKERFVGKMNLIK
ncbi:MAG: T9SS type A sorting domain-containing protein [Melioribacteraceae bacterium]|nr:T9SS type A sorting domain-containing protein [Melioribacteraceae bacterium]